MVYTTALASDLASPGSVEQRFTPAVGDPLFNLPLSGWYWQVKQPGSRLRDVRASTSLFGGSLPLLSGEEGPQRFGEIRKGYAVGPDERMLRIVERDIDLGDEGRWVVSVAGPADQIRADVRRFVTAMSITFALLGLALGLSTLLQIRFGLRPLKALRAAVVDIRRGEADRISGDYPHDIAPLAGELNLLIDTNREILDRARTHVGNLAHALKTPLSVLVNEADANSGPLADKVNEQAMVMRDHINYYLDRARAAALVGTLGTVTDVPPVASALLRTFGKIYGEKGLVLDEEVPAQARFRGERQDLEEMLGNLLDNACKWASSRVLLRAEASGDSERPRLCLIVEDDGPGIPEAARAEMVKRGRRLDETKPGSGLGLSIVADLATLYRGSLVLDASELGGVRAVLDLPGGA